MTATEVERCADYCSLPSSISISTCLARADCSLALSAWLPLHCLQCRCIVPIALCYCRIARLPHALYLDSNIGSRQRLTHFARWRLLCISSVLPCNLLLMTTLSEAATREQRHILKSRYSHRHVLYLCERSLKWKATFAPGVLLSRATLVSADAITDTASARLRQYGNHGR